MDNLTDRVDSGIKLKRNKKPQPQKSNDDNNEQRTNPLIGSETLKRDEPQIVRTPSKLSRPEASAIETPRTDAFIVDPTNTNDNKEDVIDSLKKEWSMMFNKLEVDYKNKLNDQQKQNENRLRELHDEIKQSIQMQQSQMQTSTSTLVSSPCSGSTAGSVVSAHRGDSTGSQVQTSSGQCQDPKYVTSLRMELKNKHSRHVQDLTEYYEKELEEMRKQVEYYKNAKRAETVADLVVTEVVGGGQAERDEKNSELLNKLVG